MEVRVSWPVLLLKPVLENEDMSNFYYIAEQMLSRSYESHLMDLGLADFLADVNKRCLDTGGELKSRQVIALAIELWKVVEKKK